MSFIRYEKVGRGICSILLNRPNKANAINLKLSNELREALNKFEQDDEDHLLIIGGAGSNFCAGYDLNEVVDATTGMPNVQMIEQLLWPITTSRLSKSKITIAAIHGHAAGFGFELALKCDFRVAERDSRFGFLNRRFGVPIMNGGSVILPRLVGFSRCKELIATGKAQLTPEALQQGTIDYVADIGCSFGKALSLARCLAKFPKNALMHDINQLRFRDDEKEGQLLRDERTKALEYLKLRSGPLSYAVKFIRGEIGRHGNTDLGNAFDSSPEMTL